MNKHLIKAVRKIISALVRILMRHGLSYGDFDKIARQCFVDVAYKNFSPKDKKQTVSNVSILTGLNRKEVKRLHEFDDSLKDQSSSKYNRCVRVIGGWLNDERFLTAQNTAADLTFEGNNSFSELVKDYSGDMPVVAMEKALTKSGNISVTNNIVRLLSHAYLPANDDEEKLSILGNDASEIIKTIDHNLVASPEESLFQRKAFNHCVDIEALPQIQHYLKRKGQTFLEEMDWFLSQHENKDEKEKQTKVSISMFYSDNHKDK